MDDDPFCCTYIKQEPASGDAPVAMDSVAQCLVNIKKEEGLVEGIKEEDETYDVNCGVVTSSNVCLAIKEEPSATHIDSSCELPVECTTEGSILMKEEWIEDVEEATLIDISSGNCPAVEEESVQDASGTDCTSGTVIGMASSSEVKMQIKEAWTEDGTKKENVTADVTVCDVTTYCLDGMQDTIIQAKNSDSTDSSQSDEIDHVRRDTGEKPYVCKFCNFRSNYAGDVTRNMRTHTGENPYVCERCNLRFGQAKSHMTKHSGEKPYVCGVCNYRCIRASNLKRHMITHTGEKPYVCELCNLRFGRVTHLKRHMTTHTGDNPHTCGVCNYRSIRASMLKRHMRTHTGEKPHVCPVCNFRFRQASHLKSHLTTHTGEKPHVCPVCNFRFGRASNLKTHMKTHTGEKP